MMFVAKSGGTSVQVRFYRSASNSMFMAALQFTQPMSDKWAQLQMMRAQQEGLLELDTELCHL
jgi:hypothetical protein